MKTEFEYVAWWLNALMKPAPPKPGVFEVLRSSSLIGKKPAPHKRSDSGSSPETTTTL